MLFRNNKTNLPKAQVAPLVKPPIEHAGNGVAEFMPAKHPKTVYTDVSWKGDEGGRLVLNNECMVYYGNGKPLFMPWASINHYHVSPDSFRMPLLRVVDTEENSATFQLGNQKDLSYIKTDLAARLFHYRKQVAELQHEEEEDANPKRTFDFATTPKRRNSSPPDSPVFHGKRLHKDQAQYEAKRKAEDIKKKPITSFSEFLARFFTIK